MKVLLKLLPACLAVLVLLSPPLVAWRIWQYHVEFVSAQQAVLSKLHPLSDRATLLMTDEGEFLPSDFAQSPFRAIPPALITSTSLGLIVSIPLGFYSGKRLNDRYQSRRSTTLRQQVATLEKIWQQSLY